MGLFSSSNTQCTSYISTLLSFIVNLNGRALNMSESKSILHRRKYLITNSMIRLVTDKVSARSSSSINEIVRKIVNVK
jgi:hypothetical protein